MYRELAEAICRGYMRAPNYDTWIEAWRLAFEEGWAWKGKHSQGYGLGRDAQRYHRRVTSFEPRDVRP